MEIQLVELIGDYLRDVDSFVNVLRKRIGNMNPFSAYRSGVIPKEGDFSEGDRIFKYSFHGKGCEVKIGNRVIDFDFGTNLRHDGFDTWRLNKYLLSRKDDFSEISNQSVLEQQFDDLIKKNLIIKATDKLDDLYYRR